MGWLWLDHIEETSCEVEQRRGDHSIRHTHSGQRGLDPTRELSAPATLGGVARREPARPIPVLIAGVEIGLFAYELLLDALVLESQEERIVGKATAHQIG
jgi:hypothetical protein